jgi:phage-related protein
MGYALSRNAAKHRDAKPLQGFGGAGVVEVVADHRATRSEHITVRLAAAVFVLHVFEEIEDGVATPRFERLIKSRLREAERLARGEQ